MNQQLKVGIIGDYDPKTFLSHISTNEALSHAASTLSAVAPQVTMRFGVGLDY
jgi:CTP synthase (UTP-ammonia lyase)